MKGTTPEVFHVFHGSHYKEDKGLILLPIDSVSLRNFANMRIGDYVHLDGEDKPREILRFGKVNLNTTMAELLCYYIYNCKLAKVMDRWVSNAIALGRSRESVSKEQCWIIYYKKDE